MIDRFDLRQRRLFIAFLAVGFADATMAIRLLYFPVLFFLWSMVLILVRC